MDERARIRDRRVQYETEGLDLADLHADPMDRWHHWHTEAFDAGVAEPNAVTISSVDLHGVPDARIVLIRSADKFGFTFFTNYESAKSHQLNARPVAAATFGWLDLHRQVRVRGTVERVSDTESDEYFGSRPRASQIGAWASPQSEPIRDRHELTVLDAKESDSGGGEHELGQRAPVRRRSRAATAPLGWLAVGPRRVGVLAGPAQPPPRPVPISARRRALGDPPPRSVIFAGLRPRSAVRWRERRRREVGT